ncbi:MAG: hypothetical protein EA408_00580 [Marinilabiliales bacterium]|nr:MAG: hypothetical protein EA408_00580 [Marinilabiliales bacterium]
MSPAALAGVCKPYSVINSGSFAETFLSVTFKQPCQKSSSALHSSSYAENLLQRCIQTALPKASFTRQLQTALSLFW